MHPIIVWLRRDLRVGDNTALVRAAATGAPVVPLFIVDADIVRKIPSDGAAFDFQGECLKDLSGSLESLGGRLIIRQGHVLDVHRRLLQEAHPAALYFHRDYEPAGLDRDAAVMKLYEQHDVEVETFKDIVLQEPTEVLSAKGDPFAVFTPYVGVRESLSIGTETTSKVDLDRESIAITQGYAGAVCSIWKFSLAAEYDVSFVNTLAFAVGFSL